MSFDPPVIDLKGSQTLMSRAELAMAMAGTRTRILIGLALPLICSVAATYTALHIEVGFGGQMCAILEDSNLKCWGAGSLGTLMNGFGTDYGASSSQMGDTLPFASLGTGRTVKSLGLGTQNSCVILDNDSLKCWGERFYTGQPDASSWGDSDDNVGDDMGEVGDNMPTVNLGSGVTVQQVAVGAGMACVLLHGGN